MKRNRYFQWIDGENKGLVTKLENITEFDGEYFYNFDDGETCNQRFVSKMTNNPSDLKEKFIVEVASPRDTWKFTTITSGKFRDAQTNEMIDIPPVEDITSASGTGNNINVEHSKLGQSRAVPPSYNGPFYELPSLDDYLLIEKEQDKNYVHELKGGQKGMTSVPGASMVKKSEQHIFKQMEISETDPVKILVNKAKKHSVEVDLSVDISVPSANVYNLAKEEFEDGEDKFIDYVMSNIDISIFREQLKKHLKDFYSREND